MWGHRRAVMFLVAMPLLILMLCGVLFGTAWLDDHLPEADAEPDAGGASASRIVLRAAATRSQ